MNRISDASAADLTFAPYQSASPESECQIGWTRIFYSSSDPMILTFAKWAAQEGMRMLESDHKCDELEVPISFAAIPS
jgi:hypothetical protein